LSLRRIDLKLSVELGSLVARDDVPRQTPQGMDASAPYQEGGGSTAHSERLRTQGL
jgi:hypothetical protein